MEYTYLLAETEESQWRRNEKREEKDRPPVFMRDVSRRFARLRAPAGTRAINIVSHREDGECLERIAL